MIRTAALMLSSVCCLAQAFEAASIKPMVATVGGEGSSRPRIERTVASLTMRNVDIVDCTKWAYRVEEFQIIIPKSLNRGDYEILARTAAPVSESQMRLMLQQLLADRFKLKFHRDTKVEPVYELTVGKGGPRLPKANDEGSDGHHVLNQLPRVSGSDFVFADSTLADFAAKLSLIRGVDRPVVDGTGIPGHFDLVLKGAAAASRMPEPDPTPLILVEEQFGLKAVPAKKPIEVLVIESAERPAAN